MSESKYVDITATNQVIACLYTNPSLLENEKYKFNKNDFPTKFHKILYATFYNLFQHGVSSFSPEIINDYLAEKPQIHAEYKLGQGDLYLQACEDNVQLPAFDYNYNRFKKFSLLREFEKIGVNLKEYYNPDLLLNSEKKQKQDLWLDEITIEEIVDIVDNNITKIRMSSVNNLDTDVIDMSTGIDDFLDNLSKHPDIGYPLFDDYTNTVTKGARLGKFYLRSAATNTGKSRAMVGDACTIACDTRYSIEENKWIDIGTPQSTLFICVEQTISEMQSMVLAFISAVDESKILDGNYTDDEWNRILQATQILKNSKLSFVHLPDFGLEDLEVIIKRGIRQNDCRYIFYDYLSTSMKILEEITSRSGGVRLREDQILFLMSTRLKELCVKYDIFIMSSTQLSSDFKEVEIPDQTLLRGSYKIV